MVPASRLLERVEQIESSLAHRDVPGQVHRASMLALGIVREAPSGYVAELANRVCMAIRLSLADGSSDYATSLLSALRALKIALEYARRDEPTLH